MASSLEGGGLMSVLSMIIPRNSCLTAPKNHLAKSTDRSTISSRLSTLRVEVRCSSHVTLSMRTPSRQLATSSPGSLRVCRTIRANADGSTVRPYPALLSSYSCPLGSRERPFCVCLFPRFLTPTLSLFMWRIVFLSVR